jgi:hypothetical protein
MDNKIRGAAASVLIRFDGTLIELAQVLERVLITKIQVDVSEHPPYEQIGQAEAMGFELWLSKEPTEACFLLEVETTLGGQVFSGMEDLSPWLAQLVGVVCGIENVKVHSLKGNL